MRRVFQHVVALLAAVFATYMIAFYGFNAVARQAAEQSRIHEMGGPVLLAASIPIGF